MPKPVIIKNITRWIKQVS